MIHRRGPWELYRLRQADLWGERWHTAAERCVQASREVLAAGRELGACPGLEWTPQRAEAHAAYLAAIELDAKAAKAERRAAERMERADRKKPARVFHIAPREE